MADAPSSELSRASVSLIISTYEWPDALDVVLRALAAQTDPAFEIVVADDGSGPRTADTVSRWKATLGDRLLYVWQSDEGFRRARILNLGALAASGDYLVFMDGDCIPRAGFTTAIRRAALPGWFLSTKRLNLSEAFSSRVREGHVPIWRWSTAAWLVRGRSEVRRPGFFMSLRDRRRPWRPDQPDFSPPDNGYGFFCGVSRKDLERVGGWDMRFTGWGCEDTDLSVRLRRIGLRCGLPGPGATLLHLWHPNARNPEDERFLFNEQLLFETQASDRVEAVLGLRELGAELGAGQVSANCVAVSSSSSEPPKL